MTRLRNHSLRLALVVAASLAGIPAWAETNALEESLLHVTVTYQQFNPVMPWQKHPPAVRGGYAVMVNDSLAITTWNMVRNQTLVEVRKAKSGRKMPARVELQDPQLNLALLHIGDSRTPQPTPAPAEPANPSPLPTPPSRGAGLKALEIIRHLSQKSEIQVVQFDETGQIQAGQAHWLHAAMSARPDNPFASLTFTLLTDLNISGEGAPVLHNGGIAGIMVTYDRSSRTGAMIPYSTLRRFLDDSQKPVYPGVASAGFLWAPLVDPAKKAYHGLSETQNGIQILSTIPGSGAQESLRANDVIMNWDGYDVDDLGFYMDPDFGRLNMSHLVVGRRQPGARVPVTIFRDRQTSTTEVTLTRHQDDQSLIPENFEGKQADYLVEGGLVIRELAGDYLRAFGADWKRALDPRLLQLYQTRNYSPSKPGERILILSMVLPDPVNIGYQGFHNAIITTVNGQAVANLRDVFRIRDADQQIHRVSLRSVGVDLVLDKALIPAANARLAKSYRIPELQHLAVRP